MVKELLLSATTFLTVIPAREATLERDTLTRSVALFPLIGLAIGGILAGAGLLLGRVLPSAVADMLLVLLLTALTGGLHLDGLSDTVDGLAGGSSREQALAIMKDSRIGVFGAAALFFDLSLKYLLIGALPGNSRLGAIVAFPVISRWCMALTAATQGSPRDEGLGSYIGGRSPISAAVATPIGVVVPVAFVGWKALPALGAGLVATLILASCLRRRLGGMTGDNHGAVNELVEIISLAVLVSLK